MIVWINGAFGAGKTTVAFELLRRLKNAHVYDPENPGYFIRKNSPLNSELRKGDFQDIKLWREINLKMLKLLDEKFDGVILAPMTLVNPQYFDEIIGELRRSGVRVKHFILYASRETLIVHLKKRGLGTIKYDSFAYNSIDRCIKAFDNFILDEKIYVDNMTIEQICEEISDKSGLELLPDKRNNLRKILDRALTLIKHIRF